MKTGIMFYVLLILVVNCRRSIAKRASNSKWLRIAEGEKINHKKIKQHLPLVSRDHSAFLHESIEARIVGGSDGIHFNTVDGVFDKRRHVPWQAGILMVKQPLLPFCGGTILTEDWILTAAHCFPRTYNVTDYIIRVGDLDSTRKEKDEQEFNVHTVITHPDFNEIIPGVYDYDIALIAIRRTNNHGIQFSNNVKQAYLPSEYTSFIPRSSCVISGWGRTTTDIKDGGSKILQVANVNILDSTGQEKCRKRYRHLVTNRMICAGYMDGTQIDACAGDSGGPLICNIRGYDTVVGITSWGSYRCAVTGYPGIYTNVQRMLSWIYNPA